MRKLLYFVCTETFPLEVLYPNCKKTSIYKGSVLKMNTKGKYEFAVYLYNKLTVYELSADTLMTYKDNFNPFYIKMEAEDKIISEAYAILQG